ncbi:hypothetical protein [Reichenbachiella sp.]|uniref:hypothetical protein n=1 Tax=Reichenbachiella sp. TaxID=2184521 RepID=UPI003BAEC950
MKNLKIYTLLLVSACITFSCDEEDKLINDILVENPIPVDTGDTGDAGDLDLSKYIAIGNSLTAGYQDGSLYTNAQQTGFAAMLTERFSVSGVGGGAYGFPDINSVNGYSSESDGVVLGKLILDLDLNNDGELGDAGIIAASGEDKRAELYTGEKELLTNFGVPGIVVGQLQSTATGDATNTAHPYFNPYYMRFASEVDGTATILGDAIAATPTFFTFWIGANDVLGYAAGGGDNADNSVGLTPIGDATTPGTFTYDYATSLGTLAATGSHGVVINVPPIVIQPLFQAVKYNDLELDEANATALNTGLASYNAAVQGLVTATLLTQAQADVRKVSYAAGNNPFLIEDDNTADFPDLGPLWDILVAADQMSDADRAALEPYRMCRPIVDGELVILTASTVINTTPAGFPETALYGLSLPLPDKYTLTGDEVTKIVTQRATINGTIDGIMAGMPATIKRLDIQPLFADLMGLDAATATGLALSADAIAAADGELGLVYQGYDYQPDFSPNGLFSNDAIHPNPRGHGVIANAIIELMNDEFGTNIPMVEVGQQRASPFQQ